MNTLDVATLLRERLAGALAPERLDLRDDSALHAGHAGAAGGGGHYRVVIVSARFAGLRPLARHRLVYEAAGDLLPARVHALQVHALTPEEAAARR